MKYNNVIMVAEAAYSELYCDIAKILHFQNNLRVHLYCTNDQEIESYSRKKQ